MKKIIGYVIISIPVFIGVSATVYNIAKGGWYYVISMAIMLALVGLFLLGNHLIK